MLGKYIILIFLSLYGRELVSQVNRKPLPRNAQESNRYVYCFTNWLTKPEQERINQALKKYEDSSGTWINVWIEPSLDSDDPGLKSSLRYKQTQIAHKNPHNGVILSFFESERKMTIEAGLNLEGKLTKSKRHYIIDKVILPQLKQKKYNAAIANGITETQRILAGMPESNDEELRANASERSWLDWFMNWNGALYVLLAALVPNFIAAGYVFRRLKRAEGNGIQWLFLNLLMYGMVFVPLAGAAVMYGTGRLLTPRRGGGGSGGGSYSSDDDDSSDDSSTDDDDDSSSSYSSSSSSSSSNSSSSSDYSSSGSDWSSSDSSGSSSSW